MAECGEYRGLGKYYEDIQTLEEVASLDQQIPPEPDMAWRGENAEIIIKSMKFQQIMS